MGKTQSRAGVLVSLAATAGAIGAVTTMSVTTAPSARADDTSEIIAAVQGDYMIGQSDFTAALTDFGHGSFAQGMADVLNGLDQDAVAAPDNLLLGSVEALEGDPITSSLYIGELSALGSFADYVQEAQILSNEGQGLLSNAAIDFAAGDYGAGTYSELVGSATAYVLPVEELLLGALGAFSTPY